MHYSVPNGYIRCDWVMEHVWNTAVRVAKDKQLTLREFFNYLLSAGMIQSARPRRRGNFLAGDVSKRNHNSRHQAAPENKFFPERDNEGV